MNGKLFTIGHSVHSQEEFAELLEMHKVNYLIDVRSMPFSRYSSQFNKDEISSFLASKQIKYFHMGRNFGARRSEPGLYSSDGYVDFERVRRTDLFREGLENLMKGLANGNNIALMCTEKKPVDCHRAIMVARGFALEGVDVSHILWDGSLQSQRELDEELLDMYFPDRDQVTFENLYENLPSSTEKLIENAYRLHNKVIGYNRNSSEEDE